MSGRHYRPSRTTVVLVLAAHWIAPRYSVNPLLLGIVLTLAVMSGAAVYSERYGFAWWCVGGMAGIGLTVVAASLLVMWSERRSHRVRQLARAGALPGVSGAPMGLGGR